MIHSAPGTPALRRVRWLPPALQTAGALRGLALASVIANVVIVVTGGAVRLTDSGLGCPTWPKCTDATLTPTRAYAAHGIIEFTNRQLTFILALIAVLTWLVAMARREHRGLATAALLGIPAQAVLGGLTVLSHLNPWLVAGHFLLSMTILALTFALWDRCRSVAPTVGAAPAARGLAWVTTAVAAAVLVVGTVVTGSGPHAGDLNASGKVHRTGLNVQSMAQLHADLVMLLIGLSAGLLAVLVAVRAPRPARRAAAVLIGVELAQGIVGYTQYFLQVPPLLVAVHMLGACLVWLAALAALARTRRSKQLAQRVDQQAGQRADHRAVDADELQVAPNL
jgi:cytochrome c oxidase assembly protein subunit 15